MAVDYTVGAYSTSMTISPGGVSPSASLVASLRILADGSVGNATAAWQAHVEVRGRLPRAGVVYLELVEVSGVLDAVNGPFFATTLPTNFDETFYFPLAICDGDTLEEIHTGALAW